MTASPTAMQFTGFAVEQPVERFAWKQGRHHAPDAAWPPRGAALRMDYAMTEDCPPVLKDLRVSIHYELYDGLPVFSKWLTIANGAPGKIRLDACVSELLAAVEDASVVDMRGQLLPLPNLHIETDYAFGGTAALDSQAHGAHWVPDPDYLTQVNYERRTPCLLDIGPDLGPAQEIAPGENFESFRAWVLPHDSTDRERSGLAVRRMYRLIAP